MENSRLGSTRIMTPVEPGVIALQYTDSWSAFDRGSSPQTIPGIGAARCACAVKSFRLAAEAGLPTHFLEQVDPVTVHVQEFSVPSRKSLSGEVQGRVLDAEWLWRAYVYGSLLERIQKGKADPVSLGFAPGAVVTEGTKLPHLIQECTTKFEPTDRHLTDAEARERTGLTETQWEAARQLLIGAVEVIGKQYERAGFISPDGKFELGQTAGGKVILVDVFGTPDENRILEKATGDVYSKDILRNYLKTLPWKDELDRAKAAYPSNKSKWPEYPTLPADFIDLVARRYAEVAKRYAGSGA